MTQANNPVMRVIRVFGMDGVGDIFQGETKYSVGRIPAQRLDWVSKPSVYKEYPGSRRVDLPSFQPDRMISLDAVLKERKSIRDFKASAISLGQLGYMLWASTGLQRVEGGYEFRTVPSAGALYPIETYVIANDVRKLESGVYHYSIKEHKLEEIKQGDFRRQTTAAGLGQGMCAAASAVLVWSAIFERCKWKYGQRAYRYIYLDAGHIAENLALAAVGLNLGSCEIGALFDDEVNAIVGIDGMEESTILMAAVGVPA